MNTENKQLKSIWTAIIVLSLFMFATIMWISSTMHSGISKGAYTPTDDYLLMAGDGSQLTGITKLQVGLSHVQDVDTTDPVNIIQDSTHRMVTDAFETTWNAKEPAIAASTSAKYWNGAKSFVSLVGNDISDATTMGKSLMTAASASAARSSLGAGTYSLPGSGTTAQVILGDGTVGSVPLPAYSYNMTPSHSIVTTAAAANGWQISSTRTAMVTYSTTIVSTATIAGSATGYVVLEISATNSSSAGSWQEIARTANGQAVSLAVTLQSVSTGGGQVMGLVPAGYYVRLRLVNTAGTPTYTYNSGEEVQL